MLRKMIGLVGVVLLGMNSIGCASRVNAGYVGIKINYAGTYRGVQDVPIVTGWVPYFPGLSTVLEYPTFTHNIVWAKSPSDGSPANEEITFTNSDQMQISVDVSMAYHLDPEKVPAFYMKFRTDDLETFSNGFFHNTVRDVFNEHAGHYKIEQIMGDNGTFIAEVKQSVQGLVGQYGVVIDQFGVIGAPRPPQNVIDSINLKLQAQQIAVQKQNEVAQATADAQKEVATAEGHAKAIVASAKGEADARIAAAEGEARANQIVANSISTNVMEWKKLQIQINTVQKWNGIMPQVTTGSGQAPTLFLGRPGGGF